MTSRPLRLSLLAAAAFGFAAPSLAQSGPPMPPPPPPMGTVDAAGHYYGDANADQRADPRPEWHGDPAGPQPQMRGGYDQAGYEQAREDWLAECRHNHGNGNTVGGAVIGGLVGGVIGNRVGGRGNRTLGTIAGAAVGAAAGGAIGSAADRRSARDYCETYLDRNTSQQGGYGQPGYSYGYQPMMVMVPVMMVAAPGGGQRECTTTVTTEEYVTYVQAPVRHVRALRLVRPPRPVQWRAAPVPDKRVRTN